MITSEHPAVRQIRGELVRPDDLANLTQDLIEVELENGAIIDVGWYPEHDRNGEYVIRAFRGVWENQLFPTPYRTRDYGNVERYIEYLAFCLQRPLIAVSDSSGEELLEAEIA